MWPAPGRGRAALAVAATVVAVIAVAAYLIVHGAASPSDPAASLKYGKIPSWLPSAKPPPDQTVTATEGKPVLAAIEGNTVDARLAGGSAMVTVVGPAIPQWVSNQAQSGHWAENETAPSTFTVTFARVKGVLPLRASDFQIVTTQGQIIHPTVATSDGRPLPSEVRAGQPLILSVKVGLNEGEGALRWVPLGTRVLVGWTYELEFD